MVDRAVRDFGRDFLGCDHRRRLGLGRLTMLVQAGADARNRAAPAAFGLRSLRTAAPGWVEAIWNRIDERMLDNRIEGMRVLLMGFSCNEQAFLRQELRGLGAQIVASCPKADQLGDVARLRFEFDCLVINMDAFPSVDDGVDALMDFRVTRPQTAVVLVSHAVLADDLGAERRAICDVTLRAPVSADRLRTGILTARANFETQTAPS